jgi:hypothetical protein
MYCIECNPRTSSVITEFHDSTQLAAGELVRLSRHKAPCAGGWGDVICWLTYAFQYQYTHISFKAA